MAKTKKKDAEKGPEVHDLVMDLLGDSKDAATSGNGYLLGDHAQHTWGIEVPTIAAQYGLGGTDVLPAQRWYSVSGPPKSMKSTLQIEISCWYALAGGFSRYIDSEEKSSASMFTAMTWWRFLSPDDPFTDSQGNFCHYPDEVERDPETGMPVNMDHELREILIPVSTDPHVVHAKKRMVYTDVPSIDEWQIKFSQTIEWARNMVDKYPERREPGGRVPIYSVIDSLTGKDYENNISAIAKEGHAPERSFSGAARANMIASYIRTVSFRGTCMSGGYVRHLTSNITDGSFASKFEDKEKEAGGSLANFQASVSLRLKKGSPISLASHPAMPIQGPPVEGYPCTIECAFSCLGPDIKRKVVVDVLWQHVETPDGSVRQIMVYDWHGALARLLYADKYGPNKSDAPKYKKDRLDKALYFVSAKANHVKCEALLTPEEDALSKEERDKAAVMHFTEFGRRIEASPKYSKAIQRYLGITSYPKVQEAEIDWTPPSRKEKEKD